MRIGQGGLESSSWPERPCSAVPGTPCEGSRRSQSETAWDRASLGLVRGALRLQGSGCTLAGRRKGSREAGFEWQVEVSVRCLLVQAISLEWRCRVLCRVVCVSVRSRSGGVGMWPWGAGGLASPGSSGTRPVGEL